MHIGIVTGELSGSILGAGLMQALHARRSDFAFSGVGGADMISAGFNSLYNIDRLAVMGFVDPLLRLPELIRMRSNLYKHFVQQKTNLFVGIDAPDFNLGLERKLRKKGIPIIHYVSPSVWAWRQRRIHKIAKVTDLVLTLFPFEAAFYEKHQVPASFVGHPLADKIALEPDKLAARDRLGLSPTETYIALLPGSRRSEIRFLAEIFIEIAKRAWLERPSLRFVTAAANTERNQEFQALCRQLAPGLPIHFYEQCAHDVMAASDIVLVTSGTATLETMLFKRPMVIAYRMANMTYQIARHLVKIPYIGLPNLLADRALVPEFIQDSVTPKNLLEAIFDYLDHPEKVQVLQSEFMAIHQQLRCDANQRAAEAVLNLL